MGMYVYMLLSSVTLFSVTPPGLVRVFFFFFKSEIVYCINSAKFQSILANVTQFVGVRVPFMWSTKILTPSFTIWYLGPCPSLCYTFQKVLWCSLLQTQKHYVVTLHECQGCHGYFLIFSRELTSCGNMRQDPCFNLVAYLTKLVMMTTHVHSLQTNLCFFFALLMMSTMNKLVRSVT